MKKIISFIILAITITLLPIKAVHIADIYEQHPELFHKKPAKVTYYIPVYVETNTPLELKTVYYEAEIIEPHEPEDIKPEGMALIVIKNFKEQLPFHLQAPNSKKIIVPIEKDLLSKNTYEEKKQKQIPQRAGYPITKPGNYKLRIGHKNNKPCWCSPIQITNNKISIDEISAIVAKSDLIREDEPLNIH